MNFPEKRKDLPEDYRQVYEFDILSRRADMLLINGVTVLLFMFMCLLGLLLLVGKRPLPVLELSRWKYIGWFLIVLCLIAVYLLVHLLVHGAFMRLFSGEKVRYGIDSMYLFAGSDAYFTRGEYMIIALAPAVMLGLLLLLLTFALSPVWSPAAYILQIFNVSASARDFITVVRIRKQSENARIQDTGMKVTVYASDGGFPV